jgi:glycerol-3-phosphate dehydrogenase
MWWWTGISCPAIHALLVPKTQDGRVLFAVPWLGKLILGTTDTPRQDLPREPDAFARWQRRAQD